MSMLPHTIQPGEAAPDFALPAVDRDGVVSLSDYHGRSPLLLMMFRGLWCPFCRRAIAQAGLVRDKLAAAGVESLGVVATTPENARRYFRYRPTRLPLVADPELSTHQAFGLPWPEPSEALYGAAMQVRTDAKGELPAPLPIPEAAAALDRVDQYQRTERDQGEAQRVWSQAEGQFLIDRDGIVRWYNVECEKDGLAGMGKFPSEAELLAAARSMH